MPTRVQRRFQTDKPCDRLIFKGFGRAEKCDGGWGSCLKMRLLKKDKMEENRQKSSNDAGCGRLSQNGTQSHFETAEKGLRRWGRLCVTVFHGRGKVFFQISGEIKKKFKRVSGFIEGRGRV